MPLLEHTLPYITHTVRALNIELLQQCWLKHTKCDYMLLSKPGLFILTHDENPRNTELCFGSSLWEDIIY